MARDKSFETWLRTEGIAAYDELKADPGRALNVEQVRQHLATKRRKASRLAREIAEMTDAQRRLGIMGQATEAPK